MAPVDASKGTAPGLSGHYPKVSFSVCGILVGLFAAWAAWSLTLFKHPLPGALLAAPPHFCATVYATLLASSLLQLGADAGTFKAGYIALEAVSAFISLGGHGLQAILCQPGPLSPSAVCSAQAPMSWALTAPAIITLLSLVSTRSRTLAIGSLVGAEASIAIGATAHSLPSAPPRAAAIWAALVAAAAALGCCMQLFAAIGWQLRSSKHEVKAAAVAIVATVCAAVSATFAVLWLMSWYGTLALSVQGAAVGVDLCVRALLPRALIMTMNCKSEIRQVEVMRAIESSSTYKSATNLQAMMEQKDCFMASMSHELRTPLNGIIGLTEGLLKNTFGPLTDSMRRQLHVIRMSGLRLLAMINGIMDSSAVRLKRLVIRQDVVNLHDTAADVSDLARHLCKQGVVIHNDVPKDCRVKGDSDRLIQIFNNLLGNAAKFTPSGEVRIYVRPHGPMWAVSVADTGIGIPKEKQDSIFDAFEQVDMSIARNYGGFGLGLHIVRDLVVAHGGTVSVASGPTGGSTFTFTLPMAGRNNAFSGRNVSPHRASISQRPDSGDSPRSSSARPLPATPPPGGVAQAARGQPDPAAGLVSSAISAAPPFVPAGRPEPTATNSVRRRIGGLQGARASDGAPVAAASGRPAERRRQGRVADRFKHCVSGSFEQDSP